MWFAIIVYLDGGVSIQSFLYSIKSLNYFVFSGLDLMVFEIIALARLVVVLLYYIYFTINMF